MQETVEVLKKLVAACDLFWMEDGQEDNFEAAKEDAKDHLKKLEEMSWDHEIWGIGVQPDASKMRGGAMYFTEEHAKQLCEKVNEHCETPGHWKVYRGVVSYNKEALT